MRNLLYLLKWLGNVERVMSRKVITKFTSFWNSLQTRCSGYFQFRIFCLFSHATYFYFLENPDKIRIKSVWNLYKIRAVVWSLYIRLLPKISDKRIQNLSLNCQSFLCFLFSLSHSFNEYSLPDDFSQKHFWCQISSKISIINHFLIFIVVYLSTFSQLQLFFSFMNWK